MNCPNPETLARYQAGTLPAEEAEAVRQHLSDCSACASLAAVPPPPAPPPVDESAAAPAPPLEDFAGVAAPASAYTPATMARPDCPSRDELRGYLDGSLGGERRAEVRDH